MDKDEILKAEARRFRYQANAGDINRQEAYMVIAEQLEKGIGIRTSPIDVYKEVCPRCEEMINFKFNFCPECGQKLEKRYSENETLILNRLHEIIDNINELMKKEGLPDEEYLIMKGELAAHKYDLDMFGELYE